MESASCASTSPCLTRPPMCDGARSRNTVEMSARTDRNTGASPMPMPTAMATSRVTPRTVKSMPISLRRGSPSGASASKPCNAHVPASVPARPLSNDRSRVSVKICRAMRLWPAPIARRTVISRSRRPARTSERTARFAHMMRISSPTAASSTMSAGLTSRVMRSCSSAGTNLNPCLPYCCSSIRRERLASSRLALATDASERTRVTTPME